MITGSLVSPGTFATLTFDIALIGCETSIITPESIDDEYYSYSTAGIDSSSYIDFFDWSESMGTCGPFTYTATLNDGLFTPLPSMITFDGANK